MVDSGSDPYRELFERSADAVLIIDGGNFVECNRAAVDMLRCSTREEVLQMHPSELSPPTQPDGRDSYEKANEMIATAFAHGSHRFEWEHQRVDGEVFPVEVLLTAVPRGDRQTLHVVWRDITDRKQLEEQLRHSQKMDAIGQLSGGIAHDFNNLLVAILGYSDFLKERVTDPQDVEAVEQIYSAGERAAALVRRLMAFSRKRELRPRVLELDAAIADMERLLQRIIGEHIALVTERPPAPMHVRMVEGQLEQLVLNLATNARDAMPTGGILSLGLRSVELDQDRTIKGLPAGSYAALTVADTGVGMPPEVARRAFEPFFTTKALGSGTGLGLATVYGVAHQNGGTVTLQTAVDQGTTLRIYLPLIEPIPSPPPPQPQKGPHPGLNARTILVVEDDLAVSDLVTHLLEREGYRVLNAANGKEALAIWDETAGAAIDLIVSDVVMPIMSGPEFIGALRERGEDPPVVFVSGYTNDAFGKLGEAALAFIEKPFIPSELLTTIRRALLATAAVQQAEE